MLRKSLSLKKLVKLHIGRKMVDLCLVTGMQREWWICASDLNKTRIHTKFAETPSGTKLLHFISEPEVCGCCLDLSFKDLARRRKYFD